MTENHEADVKMKMENISSKTEVENEEQIISTKKMQWEISRMQDRVYNLEVS